MPNTHHPSSHTEHRDHHLLGLGRVLGLERDHEKEKDGEHKSKEHGESWREFKPGKLSPWRLSSLVSSIVHLEMDGYLYRRDVQLSDLLPPSA